MDVGHQRSTPYQPAHIVDQVSPARWRVPTVTNSQNRFPDWMFDGPAIQFGMTSAWPAEYRANAEYIGWRIRRYTPCVMSRCCSRTSRVIDQFVSRSACDRWKSQRPIARHITPATSGPVCSGYSANENAGDAIQIRGTKNPTHARTKRPVSKPFHL